MIELHHELRNSDGKKSTAGDDLIVTVLDRFLFSAIGSDLMPDKIDHAEDFSHLKFRLGRDVMKHYLKTNKIKRAQALVDTFEYAILAVYFKILTPI